MEKSYEKEELLVCNRNVGLVLTYCRKKGLSENDILDNLGYPADYLKNPDHWISLPTFLKLCHRVQHLIDNDPNIFYQVGLLATEEGGLGIVEILKRLIGSTFADPSFVMKKIPEYNQFFNRTKYMEIISCEKNSAYLRVRFRGGIDIEEDFVSGPLVKGVFASLPRIWNLPPGKVDEILLEYDVVKLLRNQFQIFAELRNDKLYIEDTVYGEVVELVNEDTALGSICLGKHKKVESPYAPKGVLITKELWYKTYPLLIPGQIYDVPYFVIKVSWDHLPFKQRFKNLIHPHSKTNVSFKDLEERISYFQSYAQELEETIKERNKIITEEKRQVEVLKNQLSQILASHLPDDLVELMTTKKLVPSRNRGIVMFADLVDFSGRVHAEPNFPDMLKDLNRFFDLSNSIVKSRGGWVYKYLGDGIMVVFGGYKENEDYPTLCIGALEAAQKLMSLVRQMGWGLRIGLEYGDFISGEIGPEHRRGNWVWLTRPCATGSSRQRVRLAKARTRKPARRSRSQQRQCRSSLRAPPSNRKSPAKPKRSKPSGLCRHQARSIRNNQRSLSFSCIEG